MTPPNILTILVDQLRYDAFSHRGNHIIETPHIDRLAAGGAAFEDAICSSPLCGPSRASLLSGGYAFDGAYVFRNLEPHDEGPWRREITTADEALDRAGYHVEYHGKWHCGRPHRDCYRGDTRVFGHELTDYHDYLASKYPKPPLDAARKLDRYTNWPYRPWPVDDMMEQATARGFSNPHHNEAGIIDIDEEDTLTAWTAQKTIRFLRSNPTRPFVATCSILQPHAPLVAVERYARLFDPHAMPMPPNVNHSFEERPPIPDALPADGSGLGQFIALYYALVKEVDDWIGRLLAALDEAGLAEDTLVVFTADHGELMGAHRTLAKAQFFEECLRVPLILRLPGVIPAGLRTRAPASGADIAPTLLDYAGAPPLGQFHGRSLRDAIAGRADPDAFAYSELPRRQCLRSRDWKYETGPDGLERLFDLRNDPYETRNLLDESPPSRSVRETRNTLRSRLETDYPMRAAADTS